MEEQLVYQALEGVVVAAQEIEGSLFGFSQQGGDLFVDDPLGGFGVGPTADFFAAQV